MAASGERECAWNRECNRQCYNGEFHDCLLFPEIGDISFITVKFFVSATEAVNIPLLRSLNLRLVAVADMACYP
jgi:hypothetical protein